MIIKNKTYSIVTFFGLALLLLHSCAISKKMPKGPNIELPETFKGNAKDTISSSEINWKDFFEDAYLEELIDSALVNNKELNILLQKIFQSKNEIRARRGKYLPFINIGMEAGLEKTAKYTRNGSVEENLEIKEGKKFPDPLPNLGMGLYASWEIDVWKKLRNSKKSAVMEYLSSIEGKNFVVTNLVAEIANTYYELLALDNQMKNLEKNIEIQQNALNIVRRLQQATRATSLAVKRFEAEVKKNKSKLFVIKQSIIEAENKISFLTGRIPGPIKRSSINFIDLEPKTIHTGIPSQLLGNRPDIRKMELELAAAKLNVKVARADFFPSFDIRAGLGYQAFDAKYLLDVESKAFLLAGGIVAPLINRNAIKARYRNAKSHQIEIIYEYEQTILNAYREVLNHISNIDNLEKSYSLQKEQVEALSESIKIAGQLFQSARADYIEVLLTQRDALDAKMELIKTKKRQINTVINLYKALGGGWN